MKLGSLSLHSISMQVATVLLAGVASSASAGILTVFTDGTWTTAGAEDCVSCTSFGPGGGGQLFDAEYLFFKQSGSILTLGLQSGFNLVDGNQTVNGKDYFAGDLALSFDGSASTYEFGVDFGLLTKDYGSNNVNNVGQNLVDTGSGTGIDTAGLYNVTLWNTNILFGASSPFAIDGGTKIASLLSNTSGSDSPGGDLSFYRIVSFDLAGLGLGSNLNLHWTMSCGNDAINGGGRITKVSEPGTLALLGIGLLGLGVLRRRREAHAH